ncbi:MAG: DHH family phosphoesterase [Planctomycetota bacterium]
MKKPDYTAAVRAITAAKDIVLTTHLNSDADGIGTSLALMIALKRLRKRVRFIAPSKLASIYGFLPRIDQGRVIEKDTDAKAEKPCDLLISSDCGDLKRLGACAHIPRGKLLNLDHHATNDRFGDVNLVDEQATCSGLVAANLLDRLKIKLDKELAICLYATLVFDTGRFMHSNTNAGAFRFAARLADTGIDVSAVNRALTYTRSPHDLAVLRLGLEYLKVDAQEPRLAGIALTNAAIAAVGEPEDWGDMVDVPRSLAGNQVAYLLRESKDGKFTRMSLRSNPPFQVAPVAQAFGGGGHLQAAGATFSGSLADCLREVIPRLRRQLAD